MSVLQFSVQRKVPMVAIFVKSAVFYARYFIVLRYHTVFYFLGFLVFLYHTQAKYRGACCYRRRGG